MLKRKITYTDYNGNERTEEFYFNLTNVELTEMELSESGGLAKVIDEVVKDEDGTQIVRIFKDLLLNSIGVKSDDGRHFIKTDKIRTDFEHSPAYSKLFMELATEADKAQAFVNGILPKLPKVAVPEITPKTN